jgi:hypothetical protein
LKQARWQVTKMPPKSTVILIIFTVTFYRLTVWKIQRTFIFLTKKTPTVVI